MFTSKIERKNNFFFKLQRERKAHKTVGLFKTKYRFVKIYIFIAFSNLNYEGQTWEKKIWERKWGVSNGHPEHEGTIIYKNFSLRIVHSNVPLFWSSIFSFVKNLKALKCPYFHGDQTKKLREESRDRN
jgi:hypothetical protein